MQLDFASLSVFLEGYLKTLKENKSFGTFSKAYLIKRCLFKGDINEKENKVLVFIETDNPNLCFSITVFYNEDKSFEVLSIEKDPFNLLNKLKQAPTIIKEDSLLHLIPSAKGTNLKIINKNKVYITDIQSNFKDSDFKEVQIN